MQSRTYECDNLSEAAYLIASGLEPIRSRGGKPGQTIWIFERSTRLDTHVDDHARFRGVAGVIRRFMAARRRLLNETAERAL
jgi:hypothetical protein